MNNVNIRLIAQTEQAMATDPTAGIHSLRYFRRWALLGQRELGSAADVTASTIYLIETGITQRPSLVVMRKVCDALGVPADRISEFRVALGVDCPVGVKVKS